MQIPGLYNLTGKDVIPQTIFLLSGSSGAGKSMYCRNFFLDGVLNRDYCIYMDCLLNSIDFENKFKNVEKKILNQNSLFINPYKIECQKEQKLNKALEELVIAIDIGKNKFSNNSSKRIRVVIDSITHLMILFDEKLAENFIKEVYFLLKANDAMGIFTITIPSINQDTVNRLTCLFDGIIEMRMEDKNINDPNNIDSYYNLSSSFVRKMRILSIKNVAHKPHWIIFEITDNGNIIFTKEKRLNCYLCKEPIINDLVVYSDLPFHLPHLQIYKKFSRLYGMNVTDIGISSSEAINGNFFFIDIVGLSNPSLPVNKQREKIEYLNDLIASCDAFKDFEDNKIILPTGDGMVIGYLINPELPLQLSIQLHQKLKEYNIKKINKNKNDIIGVRIGLSSGPVFKVNDIKNNPNYWGPGIIYARRVMDIGNNGHILMDAYLSNSLLPLKEEYSNIIKPIGKYKIKHGIEIEIFSAYSKDFGNSELPMTDNVIY